jgi:hypothetical protein
MSDRSRQQVVILTNLNDIIREASRHFRNKKRKYLKDKIDELATNSKNKHIRNLYKGINKFKKSYQPGSILAEDENGGPVEVSCEHGNEPSSSIKFWEILE